MSGENLVVETLIYQLSTRSSACTVLNENPEYKSYCAFDIPNLIPRDESIEFIMFSIPDAQIPVSFYGVNSYNCQLDMFFLGAAHSFVFPYGNYNATLFITQFLALMTAGGFSGFNMVLNTFNSSFTITNTSYAFSLLGTSSIDFVVGFSDDISSITYAIQPLYRLDLPRPCNFLPLPRICIRCHEIAHSTMVGNIKSNTIITVPNNAKPNGQIYYINSSRMKFTFRNYELTRFEIKLTDDDGNLLDFNGISSFFTFQFDILRRYIPKPPTFRTLVKDVNDKRFLQEQEDENADMEV